MDVWYCSSDFISIAMSQQERAYMHLGRYSTVLVRSRVWRRLLSLAAGKSRFIDAGRRRDLNQDASAMYNLHLTLLPVPSSKYWLYISINKHFRIIVIYTESRRLISDTD
jgi:hypothetical protein